MDAMIPTLHLWTVWLLLKISRVAMTMAKRHVDAIDRATGRAAP